MSDLELDNNKIEYDMQMKKIKENLLKSLQDYRKTMKYMVSDAPIAILCLPKGIEKILLDNGFLRVYDLFDRDFTEVKGLGIVCAGKITTCLNQFVSMF